MTEYRTNERSDQLCFDLVPASSEDDAPPGPQLEETPQDDPSGSETCADEKPPSRFRDPVENIVCMKSKSFAINTD